MKKKLIVLIISAMILLVGCGEKITITEQYTEYIGQAKMEILNGEYDEALKYLKLAEDENTGDSTWEELAEQVNLYNELLTLLNMQSVDGIDYMKETLEKVEDFKKKDYSTNLMEEDILVLAGTIEYNISVLEEKKEVLDEVSEPLETLPSKISNSLLEKDFETASNDATSLITALDGLMYVNDGEESYDYIQLREYCNKVIQLKENVDYYNNNSEKFSDSYSTLKEKIESTGEVFIQYARPYEDNDRYSIIVKTETGYVYFSTSENMAHQESYTYYVEQSSLDDVINTHFYLSSY